MPLYYVETIFGCGIREAKGKAQALRNEKYEIGHDNVKLIRLATKDDLAWVEAMGGRVPKSLDDNQN